MNTRLPHVFAAFLLGAASLALAVPTPPPLVRDGNVPADVAARLEPGEMSMRADIRFDAFPSKGSAVGLFGLAAEADGRIRVTFHHAPLSMLGDLSVRSREAVAKGEFHQYAVIVSMLRRRVAFYIDGRLQFENDNVNIPEIAWGEPRVNAGFGGVVRDFRVWDVELESERLLNSKVAGKSVWDLKSAKNAEALRARIDRECPRGGARTDSLVAYAIDPMTDERILPDMIPHDADFSGAVNVVAAQGEYEPASVVVMALKPIGNFTLRIGDLSSGGARIPAADVDIRLVKRWYRTGGSWYTYFCDFRHRVLTPHLLVHDDALVKVDEIKNRNYFRLDYPEGVRYVDVSDPRKGHDFFGPHVPFEDAKTLQPVSNLDAFGRNQQYWLLFKGPDTPGLYKGKLDLVADGRTVAQMDVNFRVLPFALPLRPSSYDNPEIPFVNHLNLQSSLMEGRTYEERRASAIALVKSLAAHNSFEVGGFWRDKVNREIGREAGLPSDIIFDGVAPEPWQKTVLDPATGKPKAPGEITAEDRALALRRAERNKRATYEMFAREFPESEKWSITYSETGNYIALNAWQQDQARVLHKWGWNVFTHGGNNNWFIAGDIQDANIGSTTRADADRWHSVGGRVANYARPFASPENPGLHRRMLGLDRWKELHFDGNMQHGLKDHLQGINEFAPDPTGDGNYRCQIMMYKTQTGFLETLCWEGVREAYDDIRYCSMLKEMASKLADSSDEPVRREARRSLAWLERINGRNTTMSMVRSGCIDRILVLLELGKGKEGK